jgi:hypothetical protein
MTHSERIVEFLFQLSYDPGFRRPNQKEKAAKSVDEMLLRVRVLAQEWIDTEWKDDEIKSICKYVLSKLGIEKLREYALGVFDACKKEQEFKSAVTGKPVSDKQWAMLKSLGSNERPANSAIASAIIGRLMAKKKAA